MAYDLRAVGDSLATLLSVRVDLPIRQNSPPIFTVRPLTFWPQLVVWKTGVGGGQGRRAFPGAKKTQAEGKRNETKRKTGQRRATTSKVKCRKAKQGRPRWERGEGRGGEATLRLQMAWRKQEQQQHVNDNVVALREAPTETSGWERGGRYGRGDPQNR